MEHYPQPVEDYMTANMILLFVNLLWIFVAVWSAWGLLPILVIAAVLNHLISRLDHYRRERDSTLGTPADNV
ncbi:histidinol phosphate aminotransferase [Sagittula sp. S175]|uniref:histidinol phosphate aminotransferase n=1 Tax=Sagittula sp. S175 TaxID=3415129 RepID=UPI003C7C7778